MYCNVVANFQVTVQKWLIWLGELISELLWLNYRPDAIPLFPIMLDIHCVPELQA